MSKRAGEFLFLKIPARSRLKNDVFPWLGKRPIAAIDAPKILAVLKRIDSPPL